MGIFTKSSPIIGKNYDVELEKITSAFSQALESSRSLSKEMDAEIERKQLELIKIQEEKDALRETQKKADAFADNLSKLLS